MVKRGVCLLLAVLLLGAVPGLAEGAWYDQAVEDMLDWGVMDGTGGGFAPEGVVTRATVFQTLYNLEGRPESPAPTDEPSQHQEAAAGISGHWWAESARWACAAGLAQGTGEGFAGDRAATRAELVTMLYRYAQMKGVDVSVGERTNILPYEDAENVPAWAVSAFQWAVGSQTVSGKNGTLLAPTDTATRAELAQILRNYITANGDGSLAETALRGRAVSIDKFGSVQTDLTVQALTEAGYAPGDLLRVRVGQSVLQAPWVTDLSDVEQGRALVLAREGTVWLAVRQGDFATAWGVGSRGDSAVYELEETSLTLSLARKGGYADQLAVVALGDRATNDREDYSSDQVFANFREVTAGGIAPGTLFRSSSPIEAVTGRNGCADALMAQAEVNTVVNMADCRAKAPGYGAFAGTYYETVHDSGGVVYLNMGSDVYAQVGLDDLRNGLDFMAEREGPYLIHSTWGKDRAGYLVFLLEALMGAEVDEIVEDYMRSYENLYHIQPGSAAWRQLAEGSIEKDVTRLLGATDMAQARELAAEVDGDGATGLERAAGAYLMGTIGLRAEQVEALKANLAGQ